MKPFDPKAFASSLTDDELCSEVLSWSIPDNLTSDRLADFVINRKMTGFFANNLTVEQIELVTKLINERSKSPCLVTADVERGPIIYREIEKRCTASMMNLAASNDPNLAYEVGKYTARISRGIGIHLTLSPVIDINYNHANPVTNTRAGGDTPEAVRRSALCYGRGLRSEGNLAITLKHFPGDGCDDRNQHFCTTVNSLSFDEWMNTYGALYKEMIDEGAESVMVAHIALPCYDPTNDSGGYMPATLSKPLITDLLKGKLGFKGCVISDAMSMIGTAARVPLDRLSVEFLRAGGDLVLFPEKDDHARILEALHSGYLTRERLVDAATRVVTLKYKLGLFDGKAYMITPDDEEKTKEALDLVSKRSITLLRNTDGTLPLKLKKGAKVLVVSLTPRAKEYSGDDYPFFADCLEGRGYQVIRMTNPSHYAIESVIDVVDAAFVISYIDTTNCTGNSLRLGWNNMMAFWRGYIFKCKNLVFISYGDPYKLYELPYLHTYINGYINSESTVFATLECCFGEAEFIGKSPIGLEGFFDREI